MIWKNGCKVERFSAGVKLNVYVNNNENKTGTFSQGINTMFSNIIHPRTKRRPDVSSRRQGGIYGSHLVSTISVANTWRREDSNSRPVKTVFTNAQGVRWWDYKVLGRSSPNPTFWNYQRGSNPATSYMSAGSDETTGTKLRMKISVFKEHNGFILWIVR